MISRRKSTYILRVLFLALFWGVPQGKAYGKSQEETPSQPATLKAQEVLYDRDLALVIARGKVEIVQGKETLQADTVTYNQKLDMVTASGHVRMINERGDVAFADYTELGEGMKTGFIERLRILQTDESRFFASKGERRKEGMIILQDAFYSPCAQCKTNPGEPLTWDIKADRVVLDEVSQNVSYEGALLRLREVPIAYIPGLTHPGPMVKRRSGFLVPRIIPHNRALGMGIGIPYFADISPSQDLTLHPFFFTQELPLMSAKYRQKFNQGDLTLSGSYIKPDRVRGLKRNSGLETTTPTGKPRWHVLAHSHYNLSDTWRLGAHINRLSDQKYYRHYPLFGHQSDTILNSIGYGEYFNGNQYGAIQGEVFQNLSEGAYPRLTPRILPRTTLSLLSEKGSHGERWHLEGGTLSVYRHQGINTHRLSTEGGVTLPYVTQNGQEFKFRASLLGDAYYKEFHNNPSITPQQFQQAVASGALEGKNHGRARVFPRVSAEWRYPFIRYGEGERTVISPVVGVIATPQNLNKIWIPNEDCRNFELEDTNILPENRFSGRDRVDTGTRLNYGIDFMTGQKRMTSLFVGQSYSFTRPKSLFPTGSGLEGKASDYVLRLMAFPMDSLTLTYRARLDRSNLQCQWNEAGFVAGPKLFSVSTQYLFYGNKANTMTHRPYHIWRQGINSQLSENWFSSLNMTRDLTLSHQLSQEAGVRYKDGCFETEASVKRQFYRVPGIKPGLAMVISCDFKNLGDVSYKRTLEKSAGSPVSPLPLTTGALSPSSSPTS
jgi:LPS-assembly protein